MKRKSMLTLMSVFALVFASSCEPTDAQEVPAGSTAAQGAPTEAKNTGPKPEPTDEATSDSAPQKVAKPDQRPRVYQPGPHTDPLPKPKPGDWLAAHPERGQTFKQWVMFGQRNDPTPERRTIYLQPIGSFSGEKAPELETLRQFTASFFQMPVVVQKPLEVDEEKFKARASRGFGKQLFTHRILDHLETKLPDDAFCMLGVTMYDLYPDPSWNFVFGQASFQERVGVFSFVRHVPADPPSREAGERLMLLRSYKTLSHEIGHMFGIKHCTAYHCGMNGSNGQWESDAAPLHYCPVCLHKLQTAVEFDPVERYQKLEAKLAKSHPTEAKWYRERREWITAE